MLRHWQLSTKVNWFRVSFHAEINALTYINNYIIIQHEVISYNLFNYCENMCIGSATENFYTVRSEIEEFVNIIFRWARIKNISCRRNKHKPIFSEAASLAILTTHDARVTYLTNAQIQITREAFLTTRNARVTYLTYAHIQITREAIHTTHAARVTYLTDAHIQITREAIRTTHAARVTHGGMINRWPHQKTSTLDDVITRNGT